MYKLRGDAEGLSRFDPPVFENPPVISSRLEEIEREAYERGFASGERAGKEMAEKEMKIILSRLEDLIAQFISFKEEFKERMKHGIIELALSIARKIMVREISVNPEVVLQMTEEGLKRIERQGQVVIRVNPLLVEVFEKGSPGLLKIYPDIVIEPDPSLPPYGSRIMTPFQEVITDIDEQLKTLLKEISERI